jgi:DNA-binding GntR family transcriptional regulator
MMSITEQPNACHCDANQRGTKRQSIVDTLLRDVFHGRLEVGQHLITRELALRFGVSHTPVREALISLAGIGVIDLHPNRGAVVRRVTRRNIEEICDVRRVLECEAVRGACGHVPAPRLETLAADLRRLLAGELGEPFVVRAARQTDDQLHDIVASCSRNTFLAGELERLKVLFRVFRDVSWEYVEAHTDLQRVHEEAREHLDIIEALIDRRRGEAVRAMARHIESGVRYWSHAVAAPEAPPPTAMTAPVERGIIQ